MKWHILPVKWSLQCSVPRFDLWSLHIRKVAGLIPCLSRFSFSPQPKDLHIMLIGDSKLSTGVNISVHSWLVPVPSEGWMDGWMDLIACSPSSVPHWASPLTSSSSSSPPVSSSSSSPPASSSSSSSSHGQAGRVDVAVSRGGACRSITVLGRQPVSCSTVLSLASWTVSVLRQSICFITSQWMVELIVNL